MSWFYFYYSKVSRDTESVRWYGIDESGTDVTFTVRGIAPGRRMCRLYFVGNDETYWRFLNLFGKVLAHGSEEWQYHENISPIDQLDYVRGTLYSIDVHVNDRSVVLMNSAAIGICVIYASIGKAVHRSFFEMTHRQLSKEKNIYGWVQIDVHGDETEIVPTQILRHDPDRIAPNMLAISYDIEMVHMVDECEHPQCDEYCHGVPDANVKTDLVNLLTAVMWRVCNKPEVVATLEIVNVGDNVEILTLPDGFERRILGDDNQIDYTANSACRLVVSGNLELVTAYLMWSMPAHMICGWNISKFDNIQMLRIASRNSDVAQIVNSHGDLDKLARGEEKGKVGGFMDHDRYRFGWEHQLTVEGLQMATLYKMLRSNEKSLENAALALGAGKKMDMDMRDMEIHHRNFCAGNEPYNPVFMEYCLNDSMIVHRILKDINVDQMFAVNVASNIESINMCASRLPYCEPMFHKKMLEMRHAYDGRIYVYGNSYPMYTQTHMRDYLVEFEQIPGKKVYKGAIVSEPIRGNHDEVAAVDFASLYPNCAIQYSISDGTAFLVHARDAHNISNEFYHKIEVSYGPRDKEYQMVLCCIKDDDKVRQGCITRYWGYCLDFRNEVKAAMKGAAYGSDKYIQLDAQQLTVKRAANGKYGTLGMAQPSPTHNSNYACAIAYAAAITTIGRIYLIRVRMICKAMDLVPIYSDTDSCYVKTTMPCGQLAKSINDELCRMYALNDFTEQGILTRRTVGTDAPTYKSIALKVAGEANYLWVSQFVKKRYVCLYRDRKMCKICGVEHYGIMFKGGPSRSMLKFAHETVMNVYELSQGRTVELNGTEHRTIVGYIDAVFQEYITRSTPSFKLTNAKPIATYTKSTPSIQLRHNHAISAHLGIDTSTIDFCQIFPERFISRGAVPKAYKSAAFPCMRAEVDAVYGGYVIPAEAKSLGALTFLTDMKGAHITPSVTPVDVIDVEDEDAPVVLRRGVKRSADAADGFNDIDTTGGGGTASSYDSAFEYELVKIFNHHVMSLMDDVYARLDALEKNSHIDIAVHLLPREMCAKKVNFFQMFYYGIYVQRIHKILDTSDCRMAPFEMFGNTRRLAGCTLAPEIVPFKIVGKGVKIFIADQCIEDEMELVNDALGIKKLTPHRLAATYVNVFETIWGWYVVCGGTDVKFAPYGMGAIDLIKKLDV